ncbi:claudin-15-like isoform X1 [Carassius gibelio]|uniref:claudin-15-like isoform X1 n=1 Tax=Carassius gibelio TaxID=101364 RepID=UPI0022784D28|nr:claudin-15-like isoform X1 [Carassius gibelio]
MSTGVELLGFLMCLGGWLLSFVSLVNDSWRTSTFADQLITSVWYYQNLWQSCTEASTGITSCKQFESMLSLSGYIQACRALMIIALILGLLGVILAAMGLKCTKLGSTSEETKGKISLTAGIMFILSGVCVMVAVSWYAARVVQEFTNPFYGGTKYELGAGLYLGWAAATMAILGGGILCSSFKSSRPAQTRGHDYKYSSTQPQKIYMPAPASENSASKAYV